MAGKTERPSSAAITWAQRRKRVFNIDITTCEACGGGARIIACIEDRAVIGQILALFERQSPALAAYLHIARGPPQLRLPGFQD